MGEMEYLIGVDVGTTNVKAIAVASDGSLAAQAERRTRTLTPGPGAAEQFPPAVFRRVVEVVREVVVARAHFAKPAGLGFSGAMHSLIAQDGRGRCLTNAWLWSDRRAADFYRSLRASKAGREIYRRTGTPIHPMSPLVKLLGLKASYPEVFSKARLYLGLKDYVLQRLLGEKICDASLASTTGLLNTVSGEWDRMALGAAGITADLLPRVVSPADVFCLPPASAALLGLPAGLPVVPGASDGALANIGSGAEGPDKLAMTIGTSAALRLTLGSPVLDPEGRTFCYRLDDERFIAGGASNNGGNILDWLRREIFRSRQPVSRLLEEAFLVGPGSDGLLFVPYLYGERAPVWDTDAVGVCRGLTGRHGRGHLARAAVEGVVLNLRMIAEALPQWENCRSIALSGGAAQNPLWQRVAADVFDRPVEVPSPDAADASAFGAVMMAREALGLEPLPPPEPVLVLEPHPANVVTYRDVWKRFALLTVIFQSPARAR
jgi:gluconokinase